MKINIKRIDDSFNMEATNEEGVSILMDAAIHSGGRGNGMRPMQLLLTSLGGCSGMDVINILKKQKQEIESFEVELQGIRERTGDYSLFADIILHFKVKGKNISLGKVERAVELSMDKYCSVAKTLEPTAHITYKITIL